MSEQKEDALDFIREISIEQYWRRELGDDGYGAFNPADLRRWYEAMDMRGPQEINAYVIERTGRHPAGPVTGIVAAAPHPPAHIVDMWLRSQERVRTGPIWIGTLAFLVFAAVTASNLSAVPFYKWPNLVNSVPPPAILQPAQLSGPPMPTATSPQYAPGQPYAYQAFGTQVQGYQPNAPGMVAQQGTAFATQVGGPSIGGSASSAGASATSSALSGHPLGGGGIPSPGPSAYQSSAFTGAGMHTMNTGNSTMPSGQSSQGGNPAP
jgi:hypothetical protein